MDQNKGGIKKRMALDFGKITFPLRACQLNLQVGAMGLNSLPIFDGDPLGLTSLFDAQQRTQQTFDVHASFIAEFFLQALVLFRETLIS